ncbi:hypothetical protein ABFX02_02G094500 [Erythranthe guttata]
MSANAIVTPPKSVLACWLHLLWSLLLLLILSLFSATVTKNRCISCNESARARYASMDTGCKEGRIACASAASSSANGICSSGSCSSVFVAYCVPKFSSFS